MKRPSHLLLGLIFGISLAGCGRDDGEDLTAGKLPLAFTCTLDGQVAVGRATTDNTWTAGDEIAVQVDGVVKKYAYRSDGSLQAKETTPFYWQSKEDVTVEAWYPYAAGGKQPVVVLADQNTDTDYNASDFLEVTGKTVTYPAEIELVFTHRTAKVSVTLAAGTGFSGTDLASATVKLVNLSTADGNPAAIVPHGSGTEFSALLPPQTIAAHTPFIEVTVGGGVYNYTPTDALAMEAGSRYHYNVTVNKTGLTVSAPNISGWNALPGGDGTAEFRPIAVDLSNPADINGNGWYTITGTGTKTINITGGSPTVILKDATINVTGDKVSVINVTNGASPTLKIEGTSVLTSGSAGGIVLGNNCNVTIEGTGKESSSLTVTAGNVFYYPVTNVGIGAGAGSYCGDITVKDVTLTVTGGNAGSYGTAAIGTSMGGSACGNILIENSAITATGGKGAAAIGGGAMMDITIGDITIINSTVQATVIPDVLNDYFGAFIGLPYFNGSYYPGAYSCGKITINDDNISDLGTYMGGWTFSGSGSKGYKIGYGALYSGTPANPSFGGVYFNGTQVDDGKGYGKMFYD